jgi:hypothetical protein
MKERWIRVRGMVRGFAVAAWLEESGSVEGFVVELWRLFSRVVAVGDENQEVCRCVRRWVYEIDYEFCGVGVEWHLRELSH